jgi:hypothetical protein
MKIRLNRLDQGLEWLHDRRKGLQVQTHKG